MGRTLSGLFQLLVAPALLGLSPPHSPVCLTLHTAVSPCVYLCASLIKTLVTGLPAHLDNPGRAHLESLHYLHLQRLFSQSHIHRFQNVDESMFLGEPNANGSCPSSAWSHSVPFLHFLERSYLSLHCSRTEWLAPWMFLEHAGLVSAHPILYLQLSSLRICGIVRYLLPCYLLDDTSPECHTEQLSGLAACPDTPLPASWF